MVGIACVKHSPEDATRGSESGKPRFFIPQYRVRPAQRAGGGGGGIRRLICGLEPDFISLYRVLKQNRQLPRDCQNPPRRDTFRDTSGHLFCHHGTPNHHPERHLALALNRSSKLRAAAISSSKVGVSPKNIGPSIS